MQARDAGEVQPNVAVLAPSNAIARRQLERSVNQRGGPLNESQPDLKSEDGYRVRRLINGWHMQRRSVDQCDFEVERFDGHDASPTQQSGFDTSPILKRPIRALIIE